MSMLRAVSLVFMLGLTAALLSPAAGQEKDKKDKGKEPVKIEDEFPPGEEYRQFFKKPQTVADYWGALKFEIELGKYDLAAKLLRGLVALKPADPEKMKAFDEELLKLHEREGINAFLRLRLVPEWRTGTQAQKDVDELIALVTKAVRDRLSAKDRIDKYIKNLQKSPEEREFAVRELYKSGAIAVPYLIQELRNPDVNRVPVLDALVRMPAEVVPPLCAALDSRDPQLQSDVLDVFRRRGAVEAVPFLWYLSAAPEVPEAVRLRASQVLAYLTDRSVPGLPAAKDMLTREADKYYRHAVSFADPRAVVIWRWDKGGLVRGWPGAETVPLTRAEEYWGDYFASRALSLDPGYRPAQVVFLSLALDKWTERQRQELKEGGLAATPPAVRALFATTGPELAVAILDRALTERRTEVVLAATRILGDMAEPRGGRARLGNADAVLTRALDYPDRRVQFAAAEGLTRLPVPRSTADKPGVKAPLKAVASTRVVEVLQMALAAGPESQAPRVLVAYFDDVYAGKIAAALKAAGLEASRVNTGRAVLNRLAEASDVDVLLLDADLPDPPLIYLLGQLKAGRNTARLPIVVTAPPLREEGLRRFVERYPGVVVAPALLDENTIIDTVKAQVAGQTLEKGEVRDYAESAVRLLAQMATGELAGYDPTPATEAVIGALRGGRLSPTGQTAAVTFLGRQPGMRAQTELLNVVLDDRRAKDPDLGVRIAAADELLRHMQKNRPALDRAQLAALGRLYGQPNLDPTMRNLVALMIGALDPDTRLTGERLLQYRPPTPGEAKPPMPPMPPKEGGK
jgi:CheY-like chemotaxis protein